MGKSFPTKHVPNDKWNVERGKKKYEELKEGKIKISRERERKKIKVHCGSALSGRHRKPRT